MTRDRADGLKDSPPFLIPLETSPPAWRFLRGCEWDHSLLLISAKVFFHPFAAIHRPASHSLYSLNQSAARMVMYQLSRLRRCATMGMAAPALSRMACAIASCRLSRSTRFTSTWTLHVRTVDAALKLLSALCVAVSLFAAECGKFPLTATAFNLAVHDQASFAHIAARRAALLPGLLSTYQEG